MMRLIDSYLLKKGFYVVLGLLCSFAIQAKNPDWTDIRTCQEIASHFDKQAMQAFTKEKSKLVIKIAKHPWMTACFIEFWLEVHPKQQELGGITLYHQQNAYQVYMEDKHIFAKHAKVEIPKHGFSLLNKTFPWVVEGYYYILSEKYQVFSVYTKGGDYITFNFNYKAVEPFQIPTNEMLDQRMIQFINIIAGQLGY